MAWPAHNAPGSSDLGWGELAALDSVANLTACHSRIKLTWVCCSQIFHFTFHICGAFTPWESSEQPFQHWLSGWECHTQSLHFMLAPRGEEMWLPLVVCVQQNRGKWEAAWMYLVWANAVMNFQAVYCFRAWPTLKGWVTDNHSTAIFSTCTSASFSGRNPWDQSAEAAFPLFDFCW